MSIWRLSVLFLSSSKNRAAGENPTRKALSTNASGASATKIGKMFSIAREINGGAARCQLSGAYWDYNLPQGRRDICLRSTNDRTDRGRRYSAVIALTSNFN